MASSSIGSSERQASCTDVSQKRQPYQNRVNTASARKLTSVRGCRDGKMRVRSRRAARLRGADPRPRDGVPQVRGDARGLRHARAHVAPPGHMAARDLHPLQAAAPRLRRGRPAGRRGPVGGSRRQAPRRPPRGPGAGRGDVPGARGGMTGPARGYDARALATPDGIVAKAHAEADFSGATPVRSPASPASWPSTAATRRRRGSRPAPSRQRSPRASPGARQTPGGTTGAPA